jgi:hypothetical protein
MKDGVCRVAELNNETLATQHKASPDNMLHTLAHNSVQWRSSTKGELLTTVGARIVTCECGLPRSCSAVAAESAVSQRLRLIGMTNMRSTQHCNFINVKEAAVEHDRNVNPLDTGACHCHTT